MHVVILFKRRWWLKNEEQCQCVIIVKYIAMSMVSPAPLQGHDVATQKKSLLQFTHTYTDKHSHTHWNSQCSIWPFNFLWPLTDRPGELIDSNLALKIKLYRFVECSYHSHCVVRKEMRKRMRSTCSREEGGGWKMKNGAPNTSLQFTCLWFHRLAPF